MQPLLVVIAYHSGDYERTTQLLGWISELGGARPHSCLLVADEGVSPDQRAALGALAKESFDFVARIPAGVKTMWAPNGMFLSAAKWINECCKQPWLWLESDCIPLKPGWLDDLAEEYDACPMKFMGPLIKQTDQPDLPPVHLTGCSIYPPDAYGVFAAIPSLQDKIVAWDIEGAGKVVPRSKNTDLIHHFYGPKDLPPTFVDTRTADDPKNRVTLDFIRKDAVLFHRVKDGSLITLLKKKVAASAKPIIPIPPGGTGQSQPPKPPAP